MIPIASIITPATKEQYRAQLVTNLLYMGIPADQWRAGGIASTMLTVVSWLLAELNTTLSAAVSGFFLPTATGQGLVLLAYYVYGVTAPTATFASGSLRLTNSGGAVYSKAAGEVSALNPATGQTYRNRNPFTLGAVGSPTSTVDVVFDAVTQGTAGNAAPGTISQLVTPLIGVTVTNPAAFAGSDAISDAALRLLCLNALGARSVRGPRSAYGYAVQVATNPVSGNPVNINRWTVSASSHTGQVTVYIASPSGVADPDDVTGVATSIELVARPDAVTVTTGSAVELDYTNALTAWCTAPTTLTPDTLTTAIEKALVAYFSTYPVGGVTATDDVHTNFTGLFADGVKGAVAAGVATVGATLVTLQGATDVAMLPQHVMVDETTVAVRLLPPPGLS